jgi:hypothetical protein
VSNSVTSRVGLWSTGSPAMRMRWTAMAELYAVQNCRCRAVRWNDHVIELPAPEMVWRPWGARWITPRRSPPLTG